MRITSTISNRLPTFYQKIRFTDIWKCNRYPSVGNFVALPKLEIDPPVQMTSGPLLPVGSYKEATKFGFISDFLLTWINFNQHW